MRIQRVRLFIYSPAVRSWSASGSGSALFGSTSGACSSGATMRHARDRPSSLSRDAARRSSRTGAAGCTGPLRIYESLRRRHRYSVRRVHVGVDGRTLGVGTRSGHGGCLGRLILATRRWMRPTAVAIPVLMLTGMFAVTPLGPGAAASRAVPVDAAVSDQGHGRAHGQRRS